VLQIVTLFITTKSHAARILMTPTLSGFSLVAVYNCIQSSNSTIASLARRALSICARRASTSQTRFDSTTSSPSAHHNSAGTVP
jgi:hypothetical protein